MTYFENEKWMLSLIILVPVIGVIIFAATTPVPEVLEISDATVVLAYRTGDYSYRCDLRLDTGLTVNTDCAYWRKKGDKVVVNKVKSRGSKYVIQDQIYDSKNHWFSNPSFKRDD